jgi:hypothetical protein
MFVLLHSNNRASFESLKSHPLELQTGQQILSRYILFYTLTCVVWISFAEPVEGGTTRGTTALTGEPRFLISTPQGI